MPRAKFIQHTLLNTVTVCFATAMTLLSDWSALQARLHTTPSGRPPTGYSSSASAVCAVWLFFQIFFVSSIGSKLPQMKFPVIIYSIYANIGLTYGTQFPTNSALINFAVSLLKCFLTGFALAVGVHFVIFPVSARKPVFGDIAGMLGALRGILKAQTAFMQAFEDGGGPNAKESLSQTLNGNTSKASNGSAQHPIDPEVLRAREGAVKAATQGLHMLLGKTQADLPPAKREWAYGKLTAEDISESISKIRNCALPIIGLASLIDTLHQVSHFGEWDVLLTPDKSEFNALSDAEKERREHVLEEWQAVMRTMHEPCAGIVNAMDDAIEHVLLILQLKPRPKSVKKKNNTEADPENQADATAPGQAAFAAAFEEKIKAFYESRQLTLRSWSEQQGLTLAADMFDEQSTEEMHLDVSTTDGRRHRVQIYVILYMEYLFYAASKAVLAIVQYADAKVADGTMKKSRIISPGGRRLKKWLKNVVSKPETTDAGDFDLSATQQETVDLEFGKGYAELDPEHFPPRNAFERAMNLVRLIPICLRSRHCAHGFRAACATMSVAIVAYLRETQTFFFKQRLFWATIMIAFSMQRTSGQAVFSFVVRVAGTTLALVASYVIWYIVNGHAAGVLVFEFIYIACCFWILFNKPRYTILGVLAAITSVLIVGYELQVQQIGIAVSESNGQPAYPLYELAPYRLATVAGGLFIAYIWTIFPYPVSEHTELRQNVSGTMHLLSRYYTIIHETAKSRGNGTEGDPTSETSPGRVLETARLKTFTKLQVLLNQLREVASYSRWQFDFGGRFPFETYKEMSDRLERIVRCMSLIGYGSASFRDTHSDAEVSGSEWLRNFKKLVAEVDPTSHEITTRLYVLSACLLHGQPLPPYMPPFEAFNLAHRLRAMDKDILSVTHLAEPGYAAFAVLQIASRTLVDELNALTENVRTLCGEMDFSVRVADVKA